MEQDEKVRILLVDDKPEQLLALEMILEDLNEEIVKVNSGKEALRQLLKEDFAVILLDVNMPGMDGFETAGLIRQRKRSQATPIIFLTAFSDEIYIERGYSLGAVDYILAPVVPEILRAKVSVFAELHRKSILLTRQTESLKLRAIQLNKLTEASLAITAAPSLESIRQVLEQWARTLVGASGSSAIFDLQGLSHAGSGPLDASLVEELDTVVRTNKPLRLTGEIGEAPSRIIIPLVGRTGENMGLLYVSDEAAGSMMADDEAILVQLARIASIAMENVISARQLAAEIGERQEAMEQLKRSHAQLRDLAARLESVREEERTRIAREIHDELGQTLTGLKLDIGWVKQQSHQIPAQMLEKLDCMSKLADTTIQTVRNIATELRPIVLDTAGLLPALEWYATEFQSRTRIQCQLNFLLRQVRLDQDRSTAVFRIFQEILTNIARHANASGVSIMVRESAGKLVVEVSDNGRGITEEELSNPKSLGLLSMRERAALVGGQTTIDGMRGRGTRVKVLMPLGDHEGK